MSEITAENFEEEFPKIKATLEQSKFISIDSEFSALHPIVGPSFFDNPTERYSKLRKNIEKTIPVQVGITAFSFNPNDGSYEGTVYNFYVSPASFGTMPYLNKPFCFQPSTLKFLDYHGFDFNKFARLGVPFMNQIQERELLKQLKSVDFNHSGLSMVIESICEKFNEVLDEWYGDVNSAELFLHDLYVETHGNYEILYFIHEHLRCKYKNVWTCVENEKFTLRKVPEDEFNRLSSTENLKERLVSNLLGFTRIFRLLVSLQKPIIGHNLLLDILLFIENFESPLPRSYKDFKKLAHDLFPVIFDTRVLSHEIQHRVPKDKIWRDKGLGGIFEYFKNGTGRHLVPNSPAIEQKNQSEQRYHEAGWDSFCTGYIFIRMAYLNVYDKYPKSKKFVSSELVGGLMDHKNKLNVIRGLHSTIQLDGDDPSSTRPPYLVVTSIKQKSLDIHKVSSLLSSFGFVEVKKLPFEEQKALVAVDNFGSAKRILSNFKNHKEYQIAQYNTLKHSPVINGVLLGGITISGVILLLVAHSMINKK